MSGFGFTEKNNFYISRNGVGISIQKNRTPNGIRFVVPRSLGCDVTMKFLKLTGRTKKNPDSKNEIRFILCGYAFGGEGGI